MSLAARALGATAVLLALGQGPVWADVIYIRGEGPTLPPEADAFSYRPPGRNETWRAVRGRIFEVLDTEPLTLRFQPAKVERSARGARVTWLEGASIRVSVTELGRVQHEVDDLQDLRWMFSNRDELLRLQQTQEPIQFGWEPFNSYFLDAGGLPQRLPFGPLPEQITKDGKTVKLHEGWLVNWLRRGERTAEERARSVRENMANRPGDYYPILLETEIRTAVHSLLRAAAQDRKYSGMFFGIDPRARDARFTSVCKHSIRLLCDLVDQTSPNAQELGHRAREAVIQAIEAAALDRPESGEVAAPRPLTAPANENIARGRRAAALQDAFRQAKYLVRIRKDAAAGRQAIQQAQGLARSLLADDPGDRVTLDIVRQLALLQQEAASAAATPPAQEGDALVPGILTYFPVDPSEVAVIALEIIMESPSWQVPRYDVEELWTRAARMAPDERERLRPGLRLTKALVELGRDGSGGEPRANDGPRLNPDTSIPGYTRMNRLKAAAVPTLEHLLLESNPYAPEFRRHVANLLVDSVAMDGNDRSVRELAQNVLGRAGFADLEVMRQVVDRLFAMAVLDERVEQDRDARVKMLRTSLRQQIRRDAIASLSHLASLAQDRDPRRRAIADLVLGRVDEIIENQERGFSGPAEERFFGELREMAGQPTPPRPLEGYASHFRDAYRARMNELLRTHPEVANDPEARERMRHMERELGERLGGGN